MKIGISINTSWNVYNFRKGLVIDLVEKGHEVFIIAPKDGYSKQLEKLGCTFYELPMRTKSYNPFYDLILLFKYVSILRTLKIDHLFTFTIKPNIYGSIASLMSPTKVVANISGLGTTFLTHNLGAQIARRLYKFSLKFSHKVFFQNPDDQHLFVKNNIIEIEKTDVLPGSGIDLKHFDPHTLLPKKLRFTVIARTLYAKGIIEYVEAIKLIKKVHPTIEFAWIGKTESKKKLGVDEKQMRKWEKDDLLTYLPFTDNINEVIKKSTCIVLPSYREGTPRSLLEGMAMARPILTTDVPGCKQLVVNNENGILFKPQNVTSLKEALETIIKLPNNQLVLMGQKSRSLVEKNYSQEIVVKKYIDLINEWK